MTDITIIIPLPPVTKKNSPRILRSGNRPIVAPSKAFEDYQSAAGFFIGANKGLKIAERVNIKCVYYMPTRRKVDLGNLISASLDVLVYYGVLADDNSKIAAGHDGSRVKYDKNFPRAEITISEITEE